jgi:hypothetical protein
MTAAHVCRARGPAPCNAAEGVCVEGGPRDFEFSQNHATLFAQETHVLQGYRAVGMAAVPTSRPRGRPAVQRHLQVAEEAA